MIDLASGQAALAGGVQISGADIASAVQWIVGAIIAVGGLFGVIVRWMMSQISEERKFSRDALEALKGVHEANTVARQAMVSDQRVIAETQRDILAQLAHIHGERAA